MLKISINIALVIPRSINSIEIKSTFTIPSYIIMP